MEIHFGVWVGLAIFLLGLAVGVPVCWVFLGSSVVMLILIDTPLSFMPTTVYAAVDSYILMAIAFFIFAGGLMAEAGIADSLVRLSHALVGRIRGGLAAVGVVATLFLSALTGSSLPCIAALIPLLVPKLEKFGYQRRYTTAIICTSSFLGYLIPPSVPVLIYCLVAGQSVAAVFLATVIPGLMLAGGYMLVNYFSASRYMDPADEVAELPTTFKGTVKEVAGTTWFALPALGCPVLILGGIYGGIFTPNEAGAVAVLYSLFVGIFVYRKLKVKNGWDTVKQSVATLGMITLLLGFGLVFARVLIREGVAHVLAVSVIGAFGDNKYLILLMMNLFLLVAGMFIDGIPILIVVVPLIMPLIEGIGLNLIHLGSIIVVNVGVGVVTPPYAISIFVGSRLSGVPYGQLARCMLPFIIFVCFPVLILTTYIPALSLWLPTQVLGARLVGPW